MDWKRAVEEADNLYRTVKNSTILPTHMFDFWSIPYLAGRGFEISQIEGFAKIAKEMLVRGIDDDRADCAEFDARLAHYLGNGGAPKGQAVASPST